MEPTSSSQDTSDDSATTAFTDTTTETSIGSRDSPDPQLQIHAPQGDAPRKSYVGFILTMFTTVILGVYTFLAIADEMLDPALSSAPSDPPFTLSTLRKFLATAFTCFIVSMSLAVYNSSELAASEVNNKHMEELYGKSIEPLNFKTSIALHLLVGVACASLGLILVAYFGFLGWVMIGFTCVVTGIGIGLLWIQRWTYLIPPDAHID